jgi:hypothetical protein
LEFTRLEWTGSHVEVDFTLADALAELAGVEKGRTWTVAMSPGEAKSFRSPAVLPGMTVDEQGLALVKDWLKRAGAPEAGSSRGNGEVSRL